MLIFFYQYLLIFAYKIKLNCVQTRITFLMSSVFGKYYSVIYIAIDSFSNYVISNSFSQVFIPDLKECINVYLTR